VVTNRFYSPCRTVALIAQHVVAFRPTSHRRVCFKSWSMSSSALTHLAPEQIGRNNKQTRCTNRGSHSGYEYCRSFLNLRPGAHQVATSRYQRRVRLRQTQRSLKAASLRVPVRTAYSEIATDGNAQTQCPTQRRIQNTRGRWMRVHLQGTLAVEIGLPIPPSVFFGINSLDLTLGSQRKFACNRCPRNDKV
jgi:hypothetical protein